MNRKKIFLYSGLIMLMIAFIAKSLAMPAFCYRILFGIAITLKMFFLISVFRGKDFRPGLWFYLIIAGVAIILLSILFKKIYPMPVLYNILFYSAITLKMTGLILMLISQAKNKFITFKQVVSWRIGQVGRICRKSD